MLGTIPLAIVARQTRSAMLEVLGEDYIRTARAKGLPPSAHHRPACAEKRPDHGRDGDRLQTGALLGGAILTETIFSWPGIGKWMIFSVSSRDYFVVQSGLVLIAMLVMTVNLVVDLLYGLINPRILHDTVTAMSDAALNRKTAEEEARVFCCASLRSSGSISPKANWPSSASSSWYRLSRWPCWPI